jgi:GT2 family glycosyltransferase
MSARREVSLVLVAHRSSGVLPAAVGAFRRQAAQLGLTAEVIVVEHSEDGDEAERAAGSAPDRLLVRLNRGYAAGVNAGISVAQGDVLLVGNPDVELMPGALAALLRSLAAWDIVGPQFELAGALFPPAEVQTPAAEAARRLAGVGRSAWVWSLRRQLRRWRAVWDAVEPRAAPTLSGALLAFRPALVERIGPWDEGYFLYFEETDWLRRATRAGRRCAVVPAARAVHRWGHAAPPEQWQERFAVSRRRYYRRWFPLLGRLTLGLPAGEPLARRPAGEAPRGDDWRWLLSPLPAGFPAALAARGSGPEEAAAAFCRASGRRELTLVGWGAGGRRLAGPYRWSASPTGAP